MNYFLIGLVIILFLNLAIGFYFAHIIVRPDVHPYQEVYDHNVEENTLNEEEWASWKKVEVWIDSFFGYPLHGYWLPVENAIGTVVLVHGITVNHYASIKYAPAFRDRGFNVMMYDHRNHGKSGGNVTTFGDKEKIDLKTVVDWVVEKTGGIGIIGTHGESLGGATVLQHSAIDQRLSFVVADCGYADLMELLSFRLKEDYKITGYVILPIGTVFIRLIAKFWPQEINPVEMIPAVETPIFFIHGAEDSYIPPIHAQQLFDAKVRGFRKLWFAPNAAHAYSQPTNPETYYEKIGEFLKEIKVIE